MNGRTLFLGGDLGGSRTRLVAIDSSTNVIRRVERPGINWTTEASAHAEARLAEAVRALLDKASGGLHAATLAVAGVSPHGPFPVKSISRAMKHLNLNPELQVTSDLPFAFASATKEPSGLVLIAGTGAIAARVHHLKVERFVDGHGSIFGDEGSGYWIGRQAVKRALREADGRESASALGEMVADHFMVPLGSQWELIAACAQAPRAMVASLSRAVSELSLQGEHVAIEIIMQAADLLLGTLMALTPASDERLVLGGGVLAPGSEVRLRLDSALTERGLTAIDSGDAALRAAIEARNRHDSY